SPGYRITTLQAGNSNLADDVLIKRQSGPNRVEKTRVAITGLVDDVGRNGPDVGNRVLLVIGQDLRSGKRQPLGTLVLIAPAIASGPLRPGGFHKVHAQHQSVPIQRGRVELRVVLVR